MCHQTSQFPITSQFESPQRYTSTAITDHQPAMSEIEEEISAPPSPNRNVLLTIKMKIFIDTTGKVTATGEDETAV